MHIQRRYEGDDQPCDLFNKLSDLINDVRSNVDKCNNLFSKSTLRMFKKKISNKIRFLKIAYSPIQLIPFGGTMMEAVNAMVEYKEDKAEIKSSDVGEEFMEEITSSSIIGSML